MSTMPFTALPTQANRAALPAVATLAILTASCMGTNTTRCAWGVVCPAGTICDTVHEKCVLPEQIQNCDGQDAGAFCSYTGTHPVRL